MQMPSNYKTMSTYTKEQYEYALKRIEELLPITPDAPISTSAQTLELSIMSMVVEEYETQHCHIDYDLERLKNGYSFEGAAEKQVEYGLAE